MPAVPNCCCSKGSAPYWSNPLFLIFDLQALWCSGLSARVPECQKLKIMGYTSMAKCKGLTGSAVKGLICFFQLLLLFSCMWIRQLKLTTWDNKCARKLPWDYHWQHKHTRLCVHPLKYHTISTPTFIAVYVNPHKFSRKLCPLSNSLFYTGY